MRVVAFLNNQVGAAVAAELANSKKTEIIGLVVHPAKAARHRHDIVAAAGLASEYVIDGDRLRTTEGLAWIRELAPDVGVAAYFGYVLDSAVLQLFPHGVFNVHPSFLPYNRGSYPNVWSLVEGTPAGVTIHRMDEGIDTGPIVAQRQVPKQPTDTGEILYRRLERAAVSLFVESWPRICRGDFRLIPQDDALATSHRLADVHEIDAIDLDRSYRAGELLDRIRARTFSGYDGCYILHNGRKIFLEISLRDSDPIREEDDLHGPD